MNHITDEYYTGLYYDTVTGYERVIDYLTKYIDAYPECAIAYHNRGVAHKALGMNEKAMTDFNASIDIEPDRSDSYKCVGDMLSKNREYKEAIDYYRLAIKTDKKNPILFRLRATAYEEMKDYEHAIDDLKVAIALDPLFKPTYDVIIVLCEFVGRVDEAAAYRERSRLS